MDIAHPRRSTLKALALAAALPWCAPWARAAGGATDGAWSDSTRQRSIRWRLRMPSGPGPHPLVLYSHGLGGGLDAGTVWAEAWAAAGLAVLHLQHPGSDTVTLQQGLRQLRAAAMAEQLVARVQDVRFALDECARLAAGGGTPWASIRLDAVGLAGHSFGAQTAQAVAGQRFAAGDELSDARPRAFMAFSPSQPRGARTSLSEAFARVSRPFMAITGSEDGDPFGSYETGEPRAEVYQGLPAGQRALLWLDGADHMTFSGHSGTPAMRRVPAWGPFKRKGPAAERQAAHHALVTRITTDWWLAQLLNDTQALAALVQPTGLGDKDRWLMG